MHNTEPGKQVLSATTIIGDNVVNRQGDDLGKVEEIMLDTTNGRIAYAVLSFGGLFGLGNKLFAVPWNALSLDARNHRLILNVEKSVLENAPGFEKDHWPTMVDPVWATKLHSHYGTHPYWQ